MPVPLMKLLQERINNKPLPWKGAVREGGRQYIFIKGDYTGTAFL